MKELQKQKIKKLRENGLSYGSLARIFKISRARVHQICSGYLSKNNEIINKSILFRDDFECQWKEKCKGKVIKIKDLIIHHIDFNNNNNSSNNLITLCRFCHGKFHSENHINDKIVKRLKRKKKERFCINCKKVFFNRRKTCSSKCLKEVLNKKRGMSDKRKILAHNVYFDYKKGIYYKDIAKKYKICSSYVYPLIETYKDLTWN